MAKKLTIEEVKFRAKELGEWVVLDDHYEGPHAKLNCQCVKCGCKCQLVWESIQRNIKCKECNKISRLEFIRAEFKKEGYTLLTKTYKNGEKLEYICKRGHHHSIRWGDWNSKKRHRCPYCVGTAKLNIEFIRAEFAKEGYILLTKTYENAHQKLEYICPEGHRHSITWANWNSKNKHRCPYCDTRGKLTIEHIRVEFAKRGYTLLTEVYENAFQKLDCICPIGHSWSVRWNDFQQNHSCLYCSGSAKKTIQFISNVMEKEGYILLSTVYKDAYSKLYVECPEGHHYYVTWHGWQRGQRCPQRSNNVSDWEKTVKSFLSESNIEHVPNDKSQLVNPETNCSLELDVWIPDLSKAIECNGSYWHSLEKAIKRDKIKKQLCKQQGIDLLVITDEEWNKDIDKCKEKLISFVKGEAKYVI